MRPTTGALTLILLAVLQTSSGGQAENSESELPIDRYESALPEEGETSETAQFVQRAAGREKMSILDLLQTMGPAFIYPFLLFSIWAVYLILANLFIVSESRLAPVRVAREAREALLRGDLIAALRVAERRADLLSTMLAAGCAKAGREPSLIETAMEGAISADVIRIKNRIRHLADIGNLAPMVGLLGTVWGMLKVFQAVAVDSANTLLGNWSSLLAEGVAQAMVTTVVGLVIGIPSLLFFYLFRNKLSRVIGRLETFGTDLAELLSRQKPPHAVMDPPR